MASSSSAAAPPERSIFGWDPRDETASIVGDWIWRYGRGVADLEIEAKIGRIIDSHTGERLALPVASETILNMQEGWRFESSMSQPQHQQLNNLLNSLVTPSRRVSYRRVREIDYAYRNRVRVTRDSDTLAIRQPHGIIRKNRLADMNIYCPNQGFDFRISINTETDVDEEPTEESTSHREKNRLCYTHQGFEVDLTQVTRPEKPQEPLHELEVEICDTAALLRLASAAKSAPAANPQEWSDYDDFILVFLNNVRMLIRQVTP
ncbi:mRNA triphosphatase CET1 [Tilletiopsis washingtonensis]|uniref:mRNA-capping enzyme subunit beta n=1 Tax=Tilletiopsis washingtonensis TaxID=58919 RepID=A0A316Z8I1_9BASI|nr:mRNA triphosphatase CET1 [Tilletiopsis washingtonensis]PWN97909.1 mRNA triphosphatase CET1 [Tilletiopsis washingtonensis]